MLSKCNQNSFDYSELINVDKGNKASLRQGCRKHLKSGGAKSLKGHMTTPILGFKGALLHSLLKVGIMAPLAAPGSYIPTLRS